MKAVFLVSIVTFASGIFAANSSYIPSGISSGCASYLSILDQDPSLNTCTTSLLTATNAYSSSESATPSDLPSTLSGLCGDDQCSNPETRALLTQFWSACTDELNGSSPNDDVQFLYDILFTFIPFRAAVCSLDSTGNYCASNLQSNPPASSKRDSIVARDSDPVVNPTTLRNTGMPFLFMLPSSSSSQLCTPCGKSIMQAYVTWEATIPYAFGLSQSPILGGQSDLWNAMESKCGASFMSTITADSKAAPLAALSGAPGVAQAPVLTTLMGLVGLSAVVLL